MRHRVLLAVLLCMTLLAGCTGRKVDLSNETVSTIDVNGDGSVEEVVVETFDKDYYSLTELTAYVNNQPDVQDIPGCNRRWHVKNDLIFYMPFMLSIAEELYRLFDNCAVYWMTYAYVER